MTAHRARTYADARARTVREVDDDEGRRLLRTVRRGTGSVVTWRRAQMVLLSAQGMGVTKIAEVRFTSADQARDVIHNFNADGFGSLYPKYSGGRPKVGRSSARRRRGGDSSRLRLHLIVEGPGRHLCGCPGSTGEGEVPMKHLPGTPPAGRRRAGPPQPGRRSPSAKHLLRPRSSRAFVLGLCMSGLAGGVRAMLDGKGLGMTLGIFGIGILGLILTVEWVVTYARER